MPFPNNAQWLKNLLASILLTLLATLNPLPAQAQAPGIDEDQWCLICHSNPDIELKLSFGNTRSAQVKSKNFHDSVHGQEGITCSECHPDHESYPHPRITLQKNRDYTLALNKTCLECHEEQATDTQDSNHALALAEDNPNAAVCVDCHSAHYTQPLSESRQVIVNTCRRCHAKIFDEYSTSVHGQALLEDDNPDVPTCVKCHGVHSQEDPHTARFRVRSPQLCATCHANEDLMRQYGVSTDVFDTYVADFHGTTVTLFEKQSPEMATNKAVCTDCHGVHAILAMDHPEAVAASKENLLKTCQKCHPDATTNFSDSWTSHFPPTFDKQPLVASVNLFYWILIPGLIGLMGLFIVTDAGRRFIDYRKDNSG